jgi:SAM-dependent methyltransferase
MLAEAILRRCRSVGAYTLLDFSEPMLSMSRERLAQFADRLRFVRTDFRLDEWTSQVERADAVVSIQAVHEVRHKRHLPRLYAQVAAVLRPGGVFLVCDHLPGQNADARRQALYATTPEHMAALAGAGFRDVSVVIESEAMVLCKGSVDGKPLA